MAELLRSLTALVAAGLLTEQEAQLAAQALASKDDTREPTVTAPAAAFLPSDAGRPVTPVPDEVVVTAADVDAAVSAWDEVMPEYAGLLDAEAGANA